MMKLILSVSLIVCLSAGPAFASELTDSLKSGNINLKSAAQLAFGPEGILFIGDSHQAAIYAVDTADLKPAVSPANLEIKAINARIASMLGTSPDDILINDFK